MIYMKFEIFQLFYNVRNKYPEIAFLLSPVLKCSLVLYRLMNWCSA